MSSRARARTGRPASRSIAAQAASTPNSAAVGPSCGNRSWAPRMRCSTTGRISRGKSSGDSTRDRKARVEAASVAPTRPPSGATAGFR